MELEVPNRVAKTSLSESNDSSHFDECFNPIIVKTTILFITIKSLGNGRFEKLIIIYRCPWKALPLYQTQTAWLEFFIHLLEDIFRCFCKLQWHTMSSAKKLQERGLFPAFSDKSTNLTTHQQWNCENTTPSSEINVSKSNRIRKCCKYDFIWKPNRSLQLMILYFVERHPYHWVKYYPR